MNRPFGCSARIIYLIPGRLQGLCLADIKRRRSGENKDLHPYCSGLDVPMIVSLKARLACAMGGYGIRPWFYSPTILQPCSPIMQDRDRFLSEVYVR